MCMFSLHSLTPITSVAGEEEATVPVPTVSGPRASSSDKTVFEKESWKEILERIEKWNPTVPRDIVSPHAPSISPPRTGFSSFWSPSIVAYRPPLSPVRRQDTIVPPSPSKNVLDPNLILSPSIVALRKRLFSHSRPESTAIPPPSENVLDPEPTPPPIQSVVSDKDAEPTSTIPPLLLPPSYQIPSVPLPVPPPILPVPPPVSPRILPVPVPDPLPVPPRIPPVKPRAIEKRTTKAKRRTAVAARAATLWAVAAGAAAAAITAAAVYATNWM